MVGRHTLWPSELSVYGADIKGSDGRMQANLLYLKKYKLKRGEHEFSIIVKGKPKSVGVDPLGKLIDRNPNDNVKDI